MLIDLQSILSTWAFLPFDAPFYHIGNGLNVATSSTWILLGIGLLWWMRHDNKRRQSLNVDEVLAALTPQEIRDLDWKHPNFRWKP